MTNPGGSGNSDEVSTARKAWSRIGWAVLGGLGAVLIGIIVNVASWYLTDAQSIDAPEETSAECPAFSTQSVEGEDSLLVSIRGFYADCWGSVVDYLRPGDIATVRVAYQNNNAVQQDNVLLKALVPDGFEYIPGSALIANETTGGEYKAAEDGIESVAGTNVGSYAPRGNVYFKFDVRMTDALAPLCGVQSWAPTAKVTTAHSPDGLFAAGVVVTVRPPCGD